MIARVIVGAARAQAQLTRQNIEELRPALTVPLVSLVALAVLVHSGREDLAHYGLVAAALMSIGQMGNFVASEIVFQERNGQTLELVVASPSPYALVLAARVVVITAFGLVGVAEGWLLARLVFGLELRVHHPALLCATLLATSLGAAGTALLTAALFALGRQVRTFQNAINGPLYLLGGVLVPTAHLPDALQALSPFVFFSWAAGLLRAALTPVPPRGVELALSAILGLAALSAGAGALLLRRMLDRLRREGTLGLT